MAKEKERMNQEKKQKREAAMGKMSQKPERNADSRKSCVRKFIVEKVPDQRAGGRKVSSGKISSEKTEDRTMTHKKADSKCPILKRCGGCPLLDMPYEKQLQKKQKDAEELLGVFCKLDVIQGMKNPYHYRNKVHAVVGYERANAITGVYKENSRTIVPVETCMINDEKADEIIKTIREMLKSFKIRTYDEDSGYGLLRHLLIRRGFATKEIMVVLVMASPIFPSKNNFVKALLQKHPQITTIVQNVNDRQTNIVLGDKEKVLYGKGYIEDVLCGMTFRISTKSFYHVNPVQTEVLYRKALKLAGLSGTETVVDAYCGIGAIGIIASKQAKRVIGVELNSDAIKDATTNAKRNEISNIDFYCNDAARFLSNMAETGQSADVIILEPSKSGNTEELMDSIKEIRAEKVVYISCNLLTLERDLHYFRRLGYEVRGGGCVDMVPMTRHVEVVIQMTFCGDKKK